MERDARVSVVIPCYRCADTIARSVDSVLRQTLRPDELILVDDFSGDRTLDQLNRLRTLSTLLPIIVVPLTSNRGPASARNAGWDRASGDLVAFLDSDESWHPTKLQEQVSFMRANPAVKLCSHRFGRLASRESAFPDSSDLEPVSATRITLWRLLFKNEFPTCTVIVKRDLSFRFPHGQYHAEDFRLWLDMLSNGVTACRIDKVLGYKYKASFGDSGLSANMLGMERGRLRSILAVYREGGLSRAQLVTAFAVSLLKFCRKLFVVKARTFTRRLQRPTLN